MRGANDSRFCTECLPHTCHGNGDCTINPVSFAADCHCYTGYSSKYCQVNLAGALVDHQETSPGRESGIVHRRPRSA